MVNLKRIPRKRPPPPSDRSPPPSPTSLPPSVLAQASPGGRIAGRSRAHTRWLIARANKAHAEAEREVMRAELEMLKAEEERLIFEKEGLVDELLRRELGEEGERLIGDPVLPRGRDAPWLDKHGD
ncbi:hypothetical protein DACRYDRAFT_111168 [Dacryopinax primogenitus]|uniref:Uncharacterized protein n=1 Tax=Dacryopinax primogenitus (strain DJM 731) TaxID=1858805 RepID=M5FRD5_DACPD|nr:uncharacterized protein DACRYDRAFT_111168 [Dacryopinax primogenitus]EJT98193.1 hypothetical protein DACRYDRAFT_111168 [Dacryopinax primogenitus]